jgi:hypothetical protein
METAGQLVVERLNDVLTDECLRLRSMRLARDRPCRHTGCVHSWSISAARSSSARNSSGLSPVRDNSESTRLFGSLPTCTPSELCLHVPSGLNRWLLGIGGGPVRVDDGENITDARRTRASLTTHFGDTDVMAVTVKGSFRLFTRLRLVLVHRFWGGWCRFRRGRFRRRLFVGPRSTF